MRRPILLDIPAIASYLISLIFLLFSGCGERELSAGTAPREQVMALSRESLALMNSGKWEAAEELIGEGFRRYSPLNELEQWELYHLKFGYYLRYRVNVDSASGYLDSLAIVGKKVKLPALNITKAMFSKGDLLFHNRKYAASFRAYHKAYKMFFENEIESLICAFYTENKKNEIFKLDVEGNIKGLKQSV